MIGRRTSFWIVATTLGLFLFTASAPSPLYAVYAAAWRFSPAALTDVFAIYAVALLATLLLAGSLSDKIGRRPVILAAIGLQMISMALFLAASGLPWLFAARLTQGVATGLVTSAVASALFDLQPIRSPGLGPLVNSVTPMAALALGAIVSGALVQYAPAPTRLICWAMLAGYAALGVGILLIREPGERRRGHGLRVGVRREARPAFAAAVPCLVAVWSLGGFFLSLGPSLALLLAHSQNRVVGAAAIFVLAGTGAMATLALAGWPPRRAMVAGGLALVVGVGASVVAVAASAPALFFAGATIAGGGFGLAFLGAFRSLAALADPGARGALISAIYIVAYLAFSLPAVAAGYVVTLIGLRQTAIWYGAVVTLLALIGLVTTARPPRPVPDRPLIGRR